MFSLKVTGIKLITIMLCLGMFVSCSKKNDSDSPVAPTPGSSDNADYNKPLTVIPETIDVNDFPKGSPLTTEQVDAFIDFQKDEIGLDGLNSRLLARDVVYPELPKKEKEQILADRNKQPAQLSMALTNVENNCTLKSQIQELTYPKFPEIRIGNPYNGFSNYQINGDNCPVQFELNNKIVFVETSMDIDKNKNLISSKFQQQAKTDYSLQNINKSLFSNSKFHLKSGIYVNKTIQESKTRIEPQIVLMTHSYSTKYSKTEINSIHHGLILIETNSDSIGTYVNEMDTNSKYDFHKSRSVDIVQLNGVTYYHVVTYESHKDEQGNVIIKPIQKEYLNGELISSEQK